MSKLFDDSLARSLEEARRIMRPLEEIQQWNERFKEMTGAARLAEEFAQVHHSLAVDEIQKLSATSVLGIAAQGLAFSKTLGSIGVVDPGLRASLAGSLALEHAAGKTTLLDFGEEIEKSARLWRDQLKTLDLHSMARQIQDMLAGSQIASGVFRINPPINRYADTLRDLQRHLTCFSDVGLFNSLNKGLQESISPSLAALRDGIIRPAWGLMIADSFEQQGIFTWEGLGKRNPAFGSAVFFANSPSLHPLPPSSRKLLIECHIDCSICGDPMIVEGEERYWESPGKLRVAIRIVPICSACTRRAKESPDYWDEHLAHLIGKSRPSLHLIRGKGNGGTGSKSRSHLRLVKPEENDD